QRFDKRFGDITYALYLIHPIVVVVAENLLLEQRFGGLAAAFVVFVVSIALAIAIFRGVERPLMGLRNVFRGRALYNCLRLRPLVAVHDALPPEPMIRTLAGVLDIELLHGLGPGAAGGMMGRSAADVEAVEQEDRALGDMAVAEDVAEHLV